MILEIRFHQQKGLELWYAIHFHLCRFVIVPDVPVVRIVPTYSGRERTLLSLHVTIMKLVRHTLHSQTNALACGTLSVWSIPLQSNNNIMQFQHHSIMAAQHMPSQFDLQRCVFAPSHILDPAFICDPLSCDCNGCACLMTILYWKIDSFVIALILHLTFISNKPVIICGCSCLIRMRG